MSLCMAQYQETRSKKMTKSDFDTKMSLSSLLTTSFFYIFWSAALSTEESLPDKHCQDCHNMTIMWQGHCMTSMLSTIGSGNCVPLAKTKRNMKEHSLDTCHCMTSMTMSLHDNHDKHDNVTAWQACPQLLSLVLGSTSAFAPPLQAQTQCCEGEWS